MAPIGRVPEFQPLRTLVESIRAIFTYWLSLTDAYHCW